VTRYLGSRGSARVRRAALLGALPPFLLKTDDNPEGVHGEVFDAIKAAILGDRFAYLETFLTDSYSADVLGGSRISDQAWHAGFIAPLGASAYATHACVDTWLTDFLPDLRRFDVPTLVIHGTDDRILPVRAMASGCQVSSRTSGWSPWTADRTTSRGPTRTRSTRHCSPSSPSDGSPFPAWTSTSTCGLRTAHDK
jgi:pimeloyl-ACP methyl ester carboxylesterase